MEVYKGKPTFHASSRAQWRKWLLDHHTSTEGIWLIIYHKDKNVPSVYYDEAVDEGLCFGWIDSKPNKRDDQSYYQYFSKRNPKSNWSRVNKEKIERLLKEGIMHDAGLKMIEVAKATGTWDALNDVENLVIPDDLMNAFNNYPNALQYFESFPRSTKRGILEWIFNAKRAETRSKRILETASLAAENKRANQYRK